MKLYVIKYWYIEEERKQVGPTVKGDSNIGAYKFNIVKSKKEAVFEMKCENLLMAVNKLIAVCNIENKPYFQINSIESYNIPPKY